MGASLAEHSRFHSWFNTALACIAIVVSTSSAIVSWKSYSLNVEFFGFSNDFTYDCPIEFGAMREVEEKQSHAYVGLCWQMTIANQSGSRVSIVNVSSTFPLEGHPPRKWAASFLDQEGHSVAAPISFDGGEARTLVVRLGAPITDALWTIIDDAVKPQHDTTKPRASTLETLNDVASLAAQAKLDVIGNPVSVEEVGDLTYLIVFPSDYKKTIVNFRVQTGRNNVFDTQLTFPNKPGQFRAEEKATLNPTLGANSSAPNRSL